MKPIRSILTPLVAVQAHRILQNAVLLATLLRAELHLLVEPAQLKATQARLKLATAEKGNGPKPFIHAWTGDRLSDFLDAVETYDIGLVVLGLETTILGISSAPLSLEKDILEQCPVPILLTPSRRSLQRIPLESLLVAVSGERKNNEALDVAIHLANTAQIPVDILHVTPAEGPCSCEAVLLEAMKDQFHHEYPRIIEHLAAQASPFSSAREIRCIRNFSHCHGDVADEILKMIHTNPSAMLVLEWKGFLAKGRAETLRKILRQSASLVLLTKARLPPHARLKVGDHFGS